MTDKITRALPALAANIRVPDSVLMRVVGEDLVLLNMNAENYYGLNPVGARLMQLAEAGAVLEEIVVALLDEFDVERARLEVDVRAVAADLIAAGLLEEVAS